MANPKRVQKYSNKLRNRAQRTVASMVRKGATLLDIQRKLQSSKRFYGRAALEEDFRKYAEGINLTKQLSRFRPSQRIPDYFFIPRYGRALTPYKVNVTVRLRNKYSGNIFERIIDFEYRKRPTLSLIEKTRQSMLSNLKELGSVEYLNDEINYFTTSLK